MDSSRLQTFAAGAAAGALITGCVALGYAARSSSKSPSSSRAPHSASPSPSQPTLSGAEAVLAFWFGSSSADDLSGNYKNLWFARAGSPRQAELDRDIALRFSAVLGAAERGELDAWRGDPKRSVALILVLDQFSRHVHRADAAAKRANDAAALAVASACLEAGWHEDMPVPHLVFLLMVLRHSPSTARLERVLGLVDARIAKEEGCTKLLAQFRRTTMGRLETLGQSAPAAAAEDVQGGGVPGSGGVGSGCGGGADGGSGVGSGKAGEGRAGEVTGVAVDAEILEEPAFEADESDMRSHPLAVAMEAFLVARGFLPVMGSEDGVSGGNKEGGRRDGNKGNSGNDAGVGTDTGNTGNTGSSVCNCVAVSLSGGVDSMVLCKILTCLRPVYGFQIVAVHIDYANRAVSGHEASYVRRWCDAHGIVFRLRVVDEVTRGVTRRDEYEKRARQARYGMYERVLGEVGCSAIMFGHHQGDLQENVISNIMRGGSLLELAGMAAESVVSGVCVWRPLLGFGKAPIYEFARRYGVPWFVDTTPDWSTRGKLRTRLVPLLSDMYGEGFLGNLSLAAQESEEVQGLLHGNLLNPFWRSVRCR